MSHFEQVPYRPEPATPDSVFIENADPRCPVVLLLDRSGSMAGAPLEQLNAGLRAFKSEMIKDALSARRVEVAIISFGPVTADIDFVGMDQFQPPTLHPEGDTPIGRSINLALDMLARRKQAYRENGIAYFRPWVFLITDGAPTDDWTHAAERIREEEAQKRVAFFAVGVEGADFATLSKIAVRQPIRLRALRFNELFQWLSASLSAVSRSQPGAVVPLPPAQGWAEV